MLLPCALRETAEVKTVFTEVWIQALFFIFFVPYFAKRKCACLPMPPQADDCCLRILEILWHMSWILNSCGYPNSKNYINPQNMQKFSCFDVAFWLNPICASEVPLSSAIATVHIAEAMEVNCYGTSVSLCDLKSARLAVICAFCKLLCCRTLPLHVGGCWLHWRLAWHWAVEGPSRV